MALGETILLRPHPTCCGRFLRRIEGTNVDYLAVQPSLRPPSVPFLRNPSKAGFPDPLPHVSRIDHLRNVTKIAYRIIRRVTIDVINHVPRRSASFQRPNDGVREKGEVEYPDPTSAAVVGTIRTTTSKLGIPRFASGFRKSAAEQIGGSFTPPKRGVCGPVFKEFAQC